MNSYSQQTPVADLVREARCLFSSHRTQAAERVDHHIRTLRELELMIYERFQKRLQFLDVLDIGPGQFLLQMIYFAQRNRVVGIDLDVIAQGATPSLYLEMFCLNGARRTIKTIIRKISGIDRQYLQQMQRQLQLDSLPKLRVERMDACRITFSDESYDFVHSRSVFHHLPQPEAAIAHVSRILRGGGVASLSFHLYTSENGSLDPRIFTAQRDEVKLWPHLRLQRAGEFKANAFVNKLRLGEWRRLFAKWMPGAHFILNRNRRPHVAEDARSLISSGDLADYTLEELITDEVIVLWQKPSTLA